MSQEQNAQRANVLGYTVKEAVMSVEALPTGAVSRLKDAARKSAVGLAVIVALSAGGMDTAEASCLNDGVRSGAQQVNPMNRDGSVSLHKLDRLRQTNDAQGWRIVDRAVDRVIDNCARDSGIKDSRDRRMIKDVIKAGINLFGDASDRVPADIKRPQAQNVFQEIASSSSGVDATLRSFATLSDTTGSSPSSPEPVA
ncbi:hypothetical protein [Marinobacterium sp. BA1]|uniref:hypothetical protein n=1 Tax=Marinobacterium sp. BA1 TaxID=3138931 RepID=UPI0032E637AC